MVYIVSLLLAQRKFSRISDLMCYGPVKSSCQTYLMFLSMRDTALVNEAGIFDLNIWNSENYAGYSQIMYTSILCQLQCQASFSPTYETSYVSAMTPAQQSGAPTIEKTFDILSKGCNTQLQCSWIYSAS